MLPYSSLPCAFSSNDPRCQVLVEFSWQGKSEDVEVFGNGVKCKRWMPVFVKKACCKAQEPA